MYDDGELLQRFQSSRLLHHCPDHWR